MKLVASILFAIILALGGALPGANAADYEITVVVSPPVISPMSAGKYISVHTDIAYDDVDPDSVKVWIEGSENVPPHVSWDNSGNLYVTFSRVILQKLGEGTYEVKLSGTDDAGDTFTGIDLVLVR